MFGVKGEFYNYILNYTNITTTTSATASTTTTTTTTASTTTTFYSRASLSAFLMVT